MNGYEFIRQKQKQWALNKGIVIKECKNELGSFYTKSIEENLFMPLLPAITIAFSEGDGRELEKVDTEYCKLQILHSSAILAINIFQYWLDIDKISDILNILGSSLKANISTNVSCKMLFEKKYPIKPSFRVPPNIDMVFEFENSSKVIAIESKFSEPYYKGKKDKLHEVYLQDKDVKKLWFDMPSTKKLAEQICLEAGEFVYLNVAQLIRHILGLKSKYSKHDFILVYLWYAVPTPEGYKHKQEIEFLKHVLEDDGINFYAVTYQDIIVKLANHFRHGHFGYIKYITERYL